MFSDVMYAAFFDELAHMEIEKLAGMLAPMRQLSATQQRGMQALRGNSSGAAASAFPRPMTRTPAAAVNEAATTVEAFPGAFGLPRPVMPSAVNEAATTVEAFPGAFGLPRPVMPSAVNEAATTGRARAPMGRIGASEAPTVVQATRVPPAPAQPQARGSRALPDSAVASRLQQRYDARFMEGNTAVPAEITSAARANYRDIPVSTRMPAPPAVDPSRRVVTPPPIPPEALGQPRLTSTGARAPVQSDRTVVTRPSFSRGGATRRPEVSPEAVRMQPRAAEQAAQATFRDPYVPYIGSALERGRALYAA